ncbi:MAG TPA: glycosyltransferase [Ktedonobacteraceae bacterium]|jgi:D-inositol-3-phosphate glycosyltransferase
MSYSIAMLSMHTSPLDMPGSTRDAGGLNVYINQLTRELGQSQNLIDIFTRRTDKYTPKVVQITPQVRVIHIQAGPSTPIQKHEIYQYVADFAQRIDAFKRNENRHYDVLHSHYWLSGAAALQLARRWAIPHITMFHTLAHLKHLANPDEPEPSIRLEIERLLIQQADYIIASTNDERIQIIRHCAATPGQVRVIPCGIDLKLFKAQDQQQARIKLGLGHREPVLLFVGRLDPFKGPDLLLSSTAMMEEKAQIVIVGGKSSHDKDTQQLKELAVQLKISKRVHFIDAQPQYKLPAIYSAADVTVVPSYHESFGLAAVESLACGTPVVATRAGGLTTVIQNNETGFLVPRCPGFFAERLDSLLQNPTMLKEMSRAARPSVLQFSWKNVASKVQELYEDVINEEAKQLVAL